MNSAWITANPGGRERVIVTRRMIGGKWIDILTEAGFRVEVNAEDRPLVKEELVAAIGDKCAGVISQLYETWDAEMLGRLSAAGGKIVSDYAVGYNNVDLASATSLGIAVGNTPGVLTEATAELAAALTLAAARRIAKGDAYMRQGLFTNWSPTLFLGALLWRKTLGVIGAGRIGSAYVRMMAQGHRMNLLYAGNRKNEALEKEMKAFNAYLTEIGEAPLSVRRAESVDALLSESDVVSVHCPLTPETRHMIDARRLGLMKKDAVLVNTSRGPVVDEEALVAHCRAHADFRAGLDVYEREPQLAAGLASLPNVVLMPHVGSATLWTRESMAVIAAKNVVGVLRGYPVWRGASVDPFLGPNPPSASPSIVNAEGLGMKAFLQDQRRK